jgi:hypothetical protein
MGPTRDNHSTPPPVEEIECDTRQIESEIVKTLAEVGR